MLARPLLQTYPAAQQRGHFYRAGRHHHAWMVNKEGIVVVDAQFPNTAPHLITELQRKSDKPVQWLINTHHHGDHTSGNIAFKGIAKNVAAQANSLNQPKASAVKQKKRTSSFTPILPLPINGQ
jgi:cyclase